jgi:hypothetical protein
VALHRPACADRRRIPLHTRQLPPAGTFPGTFSGTFSTAFSGSRPLSGVAGDVRLAVLPDGTVLIAERDNIVSLRP